MSIRTLAVFSGITALLYLVGRGDDPNYVPLVVWLFVSAVAYGISVYVHPRRNCWSCRGLGRHTGMIFDYGRRKCTKCDGTGWQLRLGARLAGITGDSPQRGQD